MHAFSNSCIQGIQNKQIPCNKFECIFQKGMGMNDMESELQLYLGLLLFFPSLSDLQHELKMFNIF